MKALIEQDFAPEPAWWLAFDENEATVASQYVWGARPGHRDELIMRDRNTETGSESSSSEGLDERLWSLMDYYDPTSTVSTAGEVVERYQFSAFGVRAVLAPDFSPRIVSHYEWDFAFKGQFLDVDAGYYNYGYRYYSPELGRWLSRDPIGEKGGDNIYAASSNNMLNQVDYLGLINNGLPSAPIRQLPRRYYFLEITCFVVYDVGKYIGKDGNCPTNAYGEGVAGSGFEEKPTQEEVKYVQLTAIEHAKFDTKSRGVPSCCYINAIVEVKCFHKIEERQTT
jgi:RHS repeat-associated protein